MAPSTENKSKLVELYIWLEKLRKKKGGKPVQKKQSLFDYKNVMTTTYIAERVSLKGQETQKHLKLTIFNKFEHSWIFTSITGKQKRESDAQLPYQL